MTTRIWRVRLGEYTDEYDVLADTIEEAIQKVKSNKKLGREMKKDKDFEITRVQLYAESDIE